MFAANKLLDKARETCSLSTDAALAERLQVSRQMLSGWRKGRDPIPEDRIAQIARIAQVDAGEWLILIEAEQARGEARTAYGKLVKRLGLAALLALAVAPVLASTSQNPAGNVYYVSRRGFLTVMQDVFLWLRWKFSGKVAGPHLEAMTA